jgi:twitching motility protein PilT
VLDLDRLLRTAVEQRASDLHLKVGTRPWLRVDGALVEAPFDTLEPNDTEEAAARLLSPAQSEALHRAGDAECVYAVAGLARFRVSAFRQRGRVGLVLRRVVPGVPGIEALGLPPVVATLADSQSGLILVTGLAGSGRTSTIAAVVDHVNTTACRHIVTIEDPIEVLHADKASIVDQREVGVDVTNVPDALARVVRQDPDLIVLGELASAEAAQRVLEAADTGHLVLAAMATVGAVEAVDRLLDLFPRDRAATVRMVLARALRGVICQRLLARAGGRGRVVAAEVLVVNSLVSEAIADGGDPHRVEKLMHDGEYYGMQTFDQAITRLYARGLVGRDEALEHATYAPKLRLELERTDRERDQGVVAPAPAPA